MKPTGVQVLITQNLLVTHRVPISSPVGWAKGFKALQKRQVALINQEMREGELSLLLVSLAVGSTARPCPSGSPSSGAQGPLVPQPLPAHSWVSPQATGSACEARLCLLFPYNLKAFLTLIFLFLF